ncbi:MAG TPA: efflux RND transporter periplasmic adaptor subunit [Candidatus Xenobia bacterium]|jgi:HlyD family secretion protein
MKKLTLLAVAALLIGAACLMGGIKYRASTHARAPLETPTPAAMTVTTGRVAKSRLVSTLPVTGTISARDELSIGAEAVGLRIEHVLVEERATVHRGQVLAVLDDEVLEAQLQQDEARRAGAQAAESKARQPNRPQDIAGLDSALQQAEAALAQQTANQVQAKATYDNDQENAERYRQLLRQGFVTVADARNVFTQAARDQALMSAAQDQVRAAQAGVAQARSRLQMAQAGGMAQDVQIASATRAEIEGQIRQLQAQIEQTRIRAPDDGLIVKRDAHIGDITGGGKSLFTMVRKSELELRAQVPELELSRLSAGDSVRMSAFGRTVAGRIWQITPAVDPTTRLGTARIALPCSCGWLPGMFVKGVIDEGSHLALTVPLRAVQGASSSHFVFLYQDGVARRRTVVLGQTSGQQVEVTAGLREGDEFIKEGAAFLNDGDPVTLSTRQEVAHPAGLSAGLHDPGT